MKKALFIFLALASIGLYGQSKDIRAAFRLDYYMEEPTAEFVVCLPEDSTYLGATVRLTSDSGQMYSTLVEQPGGMGWKFPLPTWPRARTVSSTQSKRTRGWWKVWPN